MTLIEVLAVIAILAVLIALFLPAGHTGVPAVQTRCMINLKEISVSSLIYAGDNHDKFPIRFSITNGGTTEYLDRNQTFPHYQKFLGNMPTSSFLVICVRHKSCGRCYESSPLSLKSNLYF